MSGWLNVVALSFSADEHDPGPQKIDFVRHAGPSPLTLILGQGPMLKNFLRP